MWICNTALEKNFRTLHYGWSPSMLRSLSPFKKLASYPKLRFALKSFNIRNSVWNTHSQLVQPVNQLQSHLKTCNIAPSVRKRSFPKRLVNHPVSAYILYYVCNKFLGPILRTNRKRYTSPKKSEYWSYFFLILHYNVDVLRAEKHYTFFEKTF